MLSSEINDYLFSFWFSLANQPKGVGVFFFSSANNGMQIKSCWHLDWNVMTSNPPASPRQKKMITTSTLCYFSNEKLRGESPITTVGLRESLGRENTTWTIPPYHIKISPPKKNNNNFKFSRLYLSTTNYKLLFIS